MATATDQALGTIVLAGDLAGGSDPTNPQLTPTGAVPGEYIAPGLVVDAKGRIAYARSISNADVPCASDTQCGIAKVSDKHDIVNEGGKISLKYASKDDFGVVKVGSGFGKDCCEIFVDYIVATESTVGLVTVPGLGNLTVSGPDQLAVPLATSSVNGVVKVPNTNGFTNTAGVISYTPTVATTGAKGVVQVGSGFDITGSTLSVPAASTSVTGVFRFTSEFPFASSTYTYTTAATASSIGFVKVGSGLGVDANGVLTRGSGDATTSSKGLVQVDPSGGLSVASGVLSFANTEATAGSKGIVMPGTGMAVSAGSLSIVDATNSTKGAVGVGPSGSLVITNGLIDFGPSLLQNNTANTFTKAQVTQKVVVTPPASSATPITLDLTATNVFEITMNKDLLIGTPTNLVAGGRYILIIKQDSTGGRSFQFGTGWKLFDAYGSSNTWPSVSQAQNSISILSFTVIDAVTPVIVGQLQNNFA